MFNRNDRDKGLYRVKYYDCGKIWFARFMMFRLLLVADVLSSSARLRIAVDGGGDFGGYTPHRPAYFCGIEKANEVGKAV